MHAIWQLLFNLPLLCWNDINQSTIKNIYWRVNEGGKGGHVPYLITPFPLPSSCHWCRVFGWHSSPSLQVNANAADSLFTNLVKGGMVNWFRKLFQKWCSANVPVPEKQSYLLLALWVSYSVAEWCSLAILLGAVNKCMWHNIFYPKITFFLQLPSSSVLVEHCLEVWPKKVANILKNSVRYRLLSWWKCYVNKVLWVLSCCVTKTKTILL